MFRRYAKPAGILVVSMVTLLPAGVAAAKVTEATKTQETNVAKQEAASGGEVGKSIKAGSSRLEGARARLDAAASRTRDLERQTQNLSRELEAQRGAEAGSRARLERRARAAYKGEDLAGVTLVLSSLFGDDGAKPEAALSSPAARMLFEGRESIQSHRDSRRALEETLQQLDQKKKEYEQSQEEEQAQAEKLRGETKLEVSVGGSGSKSGQMEARIAQLREADQAGLFERPPASGGEPEFGEQELEIAQEDIVARPVEPIPYERYVQIYQESAKRYGFAKDWYVLAAVGKVESNHGENMGPSSAGAMGPMQFLPSTWRQYGVDGNGDGVANIMDPEDAIPAAAAYLKAGGAPEDWYKALYTYNHAGWYVREVLGVAEAYRRQAGDDEVEPYV